MTMTFWTALADATARALAFSLVESVLLAAFAACALRARPGATAAARHTAWLCVLVVAAALPFVSIGTSLSRIAHVRATADLRASATTIQTSQGAIAPSHAGRVSTGTSGTVRHAANRALAPSFAEIRAPRAISVAEPAFSLAAMPWHAIAFALLAIWFAGALFGLAGLVRAVLELGRIKRTARQFSAPAIDSVHSKEDAAPRRAFSLAATTAIDVPVAVGFRSPAVLIPVRVLARTASDDLARIVMHETAHLRRYDDVANLVQRTIERLFWFNPAIAYAGARLALERELAADEWVVARTGGAYDYASCLVRLLDIVRTRPRGVAAPGALLSRRDLAIRVERLLERRSATGSRRGRGGAFAVGALALAAVAAQLQLAPALAVEDAVAAPVAIAPLVPLPAIAPAPLALPTPPPADTRELARHLAAARQLSTALVLASMPPIAVLPAPRDAVAPESFATLAPELDREIESAMRELRRLQPEIDAAAARQAAAQLKLARTHIPSDLDAQIRALDAQMRSAKAGSIDSEALRSALSALRAARAQIPADLDVRVRALASMPVEDRLERQVQTLARSARNDAKLEPNGSCRGCNLAGEDLHGRDLRGVRLSGSNLSGANLRGANLAGARLEGVNLSGASLDGANLAGATLNAVTLDAATLRGAHLSGARVRAGTLAGAIFDDADVTNVAFEGCTFDGASFARARTAGVRIDGKLSSPADLAHGTDRG